MLLVSLRIVDISSNFKNPFFKRVGFFLMIKSNKSFMLYQFMPIEILKRGKSYISLFVISIFFPVMFSIYLITNFI